MASLALRRPNHWFVMIVLTDTESTLELDLLLWDGDAYLSVIVNSREYCGIKAYTAKFGFG